MATTANSTPSPTASTIAEMLAAPALDPPPNVTPHFSTHSSEQFWVYVVVVLCTVVPGLLLIMRMYTRLRIARKLDLTDYATIVGFILFLTMVAIGKQTFEAGAGVHQWNLYRYQLNNILYRIYLQNILYCPTVFCVKLVILLQYNYLLAPNRTVNPTLYCGSILLIVLNAIYYIVSCSVSIWACAPREKYWNDLLPGKCLNNNNMIVATCIWNILSDIVILLLPAWTVWKLRIPRRKRVGIVVLFATGGLACITNIFIIMYLMRMSEPTSDVSYNMAWLGCFIIAEISLGFCVIALLSLPKFMEIKGKHWLSVLTKISSSAFSMVSNNRSSQHSNSAGMTRDRDGGVGGDAGDTVPLQGVATLSEVNMPKMAHTPRAVSIEAKHSTEHV